MRLLQGVGTRMNKLRSSLEYLVLGSIADKQRVEGMEKAMRKGPESDAPTTSQQLSSMLSEPGNDLPEELSAFPPSDAIMEDLVDVYFRLLGDSFFSFLHHGLFTRKMQENTISKALLYAVCAVSARWFSLYCRLIVSHEAGWKSGEALARQLIEEATSLLRDQETSLEMVQARILLSIANYGIGDGRNCWHGLGIISASLS